MAVAAVLLIARCFRIRIVRQTVPVSAAGRLQFAIRDLMILTVVVACITAFGKWLLTVEFTPFEPGHLALVYLPFITIGLLSVWPALSARRPLLPCGIFVVIAGGVGMCFKAFVSSHGHSLLGYDDVRGGIIARGLAAGGQILRIPAGAVACRQFRKSRRSSTPGSHTVTNRGKVASASVFPVR